jgi:Ca-activated chloride channel family protein
VRRPILLIALALSATSISTAGDIWVSILEPRSGASFMGEVEIVAEALAADGIAEVEFSVDGQVVGVLTSPPFTLPIDLGTDNVGHRISIVARDNSGAEVADTVQTIPFPVAGEVKVELQQIYVTATRDEQMIDGIGQEHFTVYDDGKAQEVVTFAAGGVPFTAALLIDASASMTGHRLRAAKLGAESFIDGMVGLDQASVIVFSDQLLGTTPFSDSKSLLTACLGSATARGGTALNDHLFMAIKQLEHRQGRRVVVLLSDGIDTHSVLPMEDVEEKVRHSQALIYWIRLRRHLGDLPGDQGLNISSSWRSPKQYRSQIALLEHAVSASGGRILGIDSPDQIHDVFVDILDELRRQYAIGYYPSSAEDDGRWHKVRIDIDMAGVEARTHSGYIDH